MFEFIKRIAVAGVTAVVMTLGGTAMAKDLPKPTGRVILTVSGAISVTNGNGVAQFDEAMLKALPATEFTTSTIWTNGKQDFKGVSVKALLDLLGVTSGTLKATAINDYAIDIPVAEAGAQAPIIAYSDNGKPMSVREKGPLWVVYPYDASSDYRSELVYSRSIWQLDRIVVVK